MVTILKTIEPYKKQLRKFLPDDLFPAYGFVSICIFVLIFELIMGIRIITFFSIDIRNYIGNIFNQDVGKGMLKFWVFILFYYIISEFLFAMLNKYFDIGSKKKIIFMV